MGASLRETGSTSLRSPEPASGLVPAGNDPARGRIIVIRRYTRDKIRAHPDRLYVFGDNVSTLGRGGQARECRGERNTVGIPTKWHPAMDEGAFFRDQDFDTVKPAIQARFRQLSEHLAGGRDVVWPADGVGTGLAQLPTRAPLIHEFIERCLRHLRDSGRHPEGEKPEALRAESLPERPCADTASPELNSQINTHGRNDGT